MQESDIDKTESLLSRLQSGDLDAREELIQLCHDRLKRLARKMLKNFPSVRRWEETDDVFQRATLRLWESLKQVAPENAKHFFNLAALQIRRELIELSRSLQGPKGIGQNQDSISETPSENEFSPSSETHEASSLATWTDFHETIDKLDAEHRSVFELIWYQGLDQNTVARLLGISQKSVSRRWQKSRRQVFQLLGHQLPE